MALPLWPFVVGAGALLWLFTRPRSRVWPVKPYRSIVSRFGASRANGERIHAGSDLGALPGDEIVALDGGVVLYPVSGFSIGNGLQAVAVRHASGDFIYAEIRLDPSIFPGRGLSAGDRIGRADRNADGNSMLHIEAWERGMAPRTFTPWIPGKRPPGLLDVEKLLPEQP